MKKLMLVAALVVLTGCESFKPYPVAPYISDGDREEGYIIVTATVPVGPFTPQRADVEWDKIHDGVEEMCFFWGYSGYQAMQSINSKCTKWRGGYCLMYDEKRIFHCTGGGEFEL